ncbi:sulfotransferase 1B1-like [Liolophura sinensis]|uniref:sulfotransferase 1B1-like n=1 Tax=Liolophura sinensis TaxID=3198878 RepID=UPI0031597A8B
MPLVVISDPYGHTMNCHEFKGKHYPIRPDSDQDEILTRLPDLPCRGDDVTIIAFPKTGTHWVWEMCNMLLTGVTEIQTDNDKGKTMLEMRTEEELYSRPSVRVLNTHVTPELYPKDLVKRKSKIIYIERNPKDATVSYFHQLSKMRTINYSGAWDGFFELAIAGQVIYGSWFDYVKAWEEFFRTHEDIPVLRLCYENLKQDSAAGIAQITKFIGVDRDLAFQKKVAEQCGFENMKKGRTLSPELSKIVKTQTHPIFRKGTVGDWKNYFTVAQNESFNTERHSSFVENRSLKFNSFYQNSRMSISLAWNNPWSIFPRTNN